MQLQNQEALTAAQWADLLGVTSRQFRRRDIEHSDMRLMNGGLTKVYAWAVLPADYQEAAAGLLARHHAQSYEALLSMRRVDRRWAPTFEFGEKPSATQEKALKVKAIMAVYFSALDNRTKSQANAMARAEWVKTFGGECNEKTIRRWEARIERAGGFESAPLEAYCDNKDVKHTRNTKGIPREFLIEFRAKACEPGHVNISRAIHHFTILWETGQEVPGYGVRQSEDQPFPLSEHTLRKFAPGRAARETAGRGKFAAKTKKAIPALPLSSRGLRMRQRIVFDDKRPDVVLLDDDTGAQFEPWIYLAMDEATRKILGWAFRSEGHMHQADTDAFTAGILRSAGFSSGDAELVTTLKYERGETAIGTEREWLLKSLFPRQIDISRTRMIGGHNVPGDFAQKASGNFMGKGKLESFMKTFDCFFAHLAGQRGNNAQLAQPAMLGDTTLTLNTILHPNYKMKGTMIEEALLCAHGAMAVSWMAGENVSAREAAERTGITPPLIWRSDFVKYMAIIIAYYNRRRGHRMEGFETITINGRDGKPERVSESPDDKERRLEHELAGQGGRIVRLSEADTMLLLHKCKKVKVTPSGVSMLGKIFWSEHSKAVWEAQHNTTLEKYYLALYDPQRLEEIYLVRNPVSHFRERDETLGGETPVFFECLPLYIAPDQTNPEQMRERADRIATNQNRVMREVAIVTQPTIDAQTQRRLENTEKLKNIRAAIMTIEPQDRPVLNATGAAQGFTDAVQDRANGVTRAEAKPEAVSRLDKFLATHAPEPEATAAETEPEIF